MGNVFNDQHPILYRPFRPSHFTKRLAGTRQKIVPLVSSIIELIGKFLFSFLLIPVFGYTAVIWSEPLIWVCMTIQLWFAYTRLPSIQEARNHTSIDLALDR